MINDSNNFREIIPNNKAILCLDLGKKRIGLSISDVNQKIASPYDVIQEKKFSEIYLRVIKREKNQLKRFISMTQTRLDLQQLQKQRITQPTRKFLIMRLLEHLHYQF
mgnify:CR=1 FL=1